MHSFIPSELKFRPMTQVLDGTIFVHSEPVRGIFYTGEDFSRLEIHIRGIRGLLPPIMMILESSFWVEGGGVCMSIQFPILTRTSQRGASDQHSWTDPAHPLHSNPYQPATPPSVFSTHYSTLLHIPHCTKIKAEY